MPEEPRETVTVEVLAASPAEVWHGGRQLTPGEWAVMARDEAERHVAAGCAAIRAPAPEPQPTQSPRSSRPSRA